MRNARLQENKKDRESLNITLSKQKLKPAEGAIAISGNGTIELRKQNLVSRAQSISESVEAENVNYLQNKYSYNNIHKNTQNAYSNLIIANNFDYNKRSMS